MTHYTAALEATTIALDLETWAPPGAKTERKFLRKGKTKKPCPALDWQVARMRLISLCTPDSDQPVVIDLGVKPSLGMRIAIAGLLRKLESVEIIGHNLVFDLAFLGHEFGFRPRKVWDTMTAVRLLENDDLAEVKNLKGGRYESDPNDYHASLESALYYYIGVAVDKALGGGGESDFGASALSDAQYLYAAGDTRHLPALAAHLLREIAEAGLSRIAALEMDLIPWAAQAELVGIPVDVAALDKEIDWRREALAEAATRVEAAMKADGFDAPPFYQRKRKRDPLKLNVNSNLLKNALFQARQDEEGTFIVLPLTPTGQPSFTQEALEEVKHPVARAYLQYDGLSAELVTLCQRRKHVWERTSSIHPTIKLRGANSGRITVENPAMQNVPEGERSVYCAPPGKGLVGGDLSKIELRAQAQFSKDPNLTDAFNWPPRTRKATSMRWLALRFGQARSRMSPGTSSIPTTSSVKR